MHLESKISICGVLDHIFQDESNERFGNIFKSIAIWFADKTKNNTNNKIGFKKYYFYIFAIFGFVIVLIDSLLRLLFKYFIKIDKSSEGYNFGCVSFADSHELVLSEFKKQCSVDGGSFVNISGRPIGSLFSKKWGYKYIDDNISLVGVVRQIIDSIYFLLFGASRAIEFLSVIGKDIGVNDAALLSIKIFQSLRFNIWSSSFFKKNSFDFIFLGNDTCYRAFWLVNNSRPSKSITIQHGIPENIIQYYSVSDYFVFWDPISFGRLYKNPAVRYIYGGYPKERLMLCEKSNRRDGIIAVCTKFENIKDLELMKEFSSIIRKSGIDFEIKFHPLESIEHKKILSDAVEYWGDIKGVGDFSYVVVIDSTFAIDLVASGREIIPLSFDAKNSFGKYFKPVFMGSFLEIIRKLSGDDIKNFLNSVQICEPKFKFSKFEFFEKSISVNGTLIC